jgi:hypothetical protein
MKTTTNIYKLAEKLNAKVWEKGDMKRIYLNDEGYNTKKMSSKTFIWQDEDGEFKVSCRIDCPSQGWNWIKSQQEEVIEHVERKIREALADTYYMPVHKESGKAFDEGCMVTREEFMLHPDTYLSEEDAIKSIKDNEENVDDFDIVAISREDAEKESEEAWEAWRAKKA